MHEDSEQVCTEVRGKNLLYPATKQQKIYAIALQNS